MQNVERDLSAGCLKRLFLVQAKDDIEQPIELGRCGTHLAKAQGPNGWRNCNLRTAFDKLVRRAGLESWPRLFHNLRSSRETELLESFPVHVVAMWMGHDAKVSLKHYAQTTQDHFDRATGGAKSGALGAQNQAQQDAADNGGESYEGSANAELVGSSAVPCETQPIAAKRLNGEDGIRTRDGVLPPYRFSKPALSATQPPLQVI